MLNPASDIAEVPTAGTAGLISVLVSIALEACSSGFRPGSAGRTPEDCEGHEAPRRLGWALGFLAFLIALSFAVPPWRMPSPEHPLAADVVPKRIEDWRSTDLDTDRLFLGMAALVGSVDRRYVHAGNWVDVYIASGSPHQRCALIAETARLTAVDLPRNSFDARSVRRSRFLGRKGPSGPGATVPGTRGLLESTVRDVLRPRSQPVRANWLGAVLTSHAVESQAGRGLCSAPTDGGRETGALAESDFASPRGVSCSAESPFHFSPG